jgi:hypothetical protein
MAITMNVKIGVAEYHDYRDGNHKKVRANLNSWHGIYAATFTEKEMDTVDWHQLHEMAKYHDQKGLEFHIYFVATVPEKPKDISRKISEK